MRITIVSRTLSDRGQVYDVILSHHDQTIRLPCNDRDCARVLADMLCDAVNDFTVIEATLAFGECDV